MMSGRMMRRNVVNHDAPRSNAASSMSPVDRRDPRQQQQHAEGKGEHDVADEYGPEPERNRYHRIGGPEEDQERDPENDRRYHQGQEHEAGESRLIRKLRLASA